MIKTALTIRQVRRSKDITQKEMARALEIHIQTYRKIEENPERATIAQAKAIATVLGMNYDELLFARDST